MVCSHLEASDLQTVKVNADLNLTSDQSRGGSFVFPSVMMFVFPRHDRKVVSHPDQNVAQAQAAFLFKSVRCCCDCHHELDLKSSYDLGL